ncbi:MAG: lipoprotein [Pseudomonadota bacterium]
MKFLVKSALALSAIASLAGCGLRGDLERPPPIFSDPPSEEAQKPVDSAALYLSAQFDDNRVYLNSLGGEIPKPAPDVDVEEESMGEIGPG